MSSWGCGTAKRASGALEFHVEIRGIGRHSVRRRQLKAERASEHRGGEPKQTGQLRSGCPHDELLVPYFLFQNRNGSKNHLYVGVKTMSQEHLCNGKVAARSLLRP